jgi:CelD/BcsL family acetyltransferase involved in cellulose biosynthesis
MKIKIKILRNFEKSLEKIWIGFEKESVNFCFQNFYWLKNWYLNLENKKIDIFNVLVYGDNHLIAILPLSIENNKNIKFLKWQGGDRSDYMCGLFSKSIFLKKTDFFYLWKLIKKDISSFDIVYFEKQPQFIENIANPFVSYFKVFKDSFSSSAMLEATFEDFQKKNLKNKFIADTKRSLNNLNKYGKIKYNIYDNLDKNKQKNITQEILNQKISRSKDLKLKNIFDQNSQDFYLNFDNSNFKNGNLHISSLELNGELISLHWGVVYKKTFYYLMPSLPKSEYMKYSPGRILLQYLIKWSIDNNIKKLDFTIGDEKYKKDWSNRNEFLFSYLESNTIFYLLNYFLLYIKIILKNFLKKSVILKNFYRLIVRILR